jgi:hypothetical protein
MVMVMVMIMIVSFMVMVVIIVRMIVVRILCALQVLFTLRVFFGFLGCHLPLRDRRV